MTVDNYLADDETYVAYQGDKYLARILAPLQTRTIRKYVKQGKLPGFFMGHDVVISKELINQFIAGDWTPQQRDDVKEQSPVANVSIMKRRGKAA